MHSSASFGGPTGSARRRHTSPRVPPQSRTAEVCGRHCLHHNLKRLAGMHGLPMRDLAALIGASESVVNKWQTGARNPSFTYALRVGELFQVDAGKLATMTFDELLERDLTAEQYRRAELKAPMRV
jgi:DNA-binding XRE family transcriptional regulator